jgi:glycosyltransferase involved in cell wall biosynthesis
VAKSKVFVGPGNIAGFAMFIAKSLKSNDVEAKSYSYRAHPFGYPCDYDDILFKSPFKITDRKKFFQKVLINRYSVNIICSIQKLILFIICILRYKTFIFISHETFFDNNIDLVLLKVLKKKIAFVFVGCPERDPKNILNTTDRGFCSFCKDIPMQTSLRCFEGDKKSHKINYISSYADIVFSHRDTTSFIIDKSKIRPFYCISYSSMMINEIYNKFQKRYQAVITHLPSNKLLKGTESVEKSIKKLKELGYRIEYLSDQVNHSDVEKILMKTNILIDQFSFGNGLLAVEGMANGCVVICRTAKWFKADFPELPLVSCEPEELTNTLIDLLDHPEKMLKVALSSFEYYKKFHTPEIVGNYYKKTLDLI